ncbi:MAG: dihydrolipoamide acetyltransferase family protein [Halobacteriales archaeon]|nr:dihydrolipoamide acetyltransferase family protein [Halobacteriales archaeon]
MPREFKLPDVGEGVAEGEIVSWLVEVGDTVTEDQPVAEVETDKAIVEVPSPVDGTVKEIRAEAGEVVPVGEVIIVFDVEGETVEPTPEPSVEADDPAEESAAEAPAEPDEPTAGGRVFASPGVRRLARELDINLGDIEGTGPGGRITESDVRAAAESTPEPATAAEEEPEPVAETETAPTSTTTATEPAGRERTLATPATRGLARELDVDINDVPAVEERDGEAFVTADAVREYAQAREAEPTATDETAGAAGHPTPATGHPSGDEERIPYRGIRRTIGEHMTESVDTIPHVTHHDLLDVEELVATRNELKARAEERDITLTYLPFVMKAVVAGLKEYPYLNASLDMEAEEIVLKNDYHIGFAAATDDGLLVPVIDHVDRKGILQLASEIAELAQKARDRTITREEMQGSTFTITNYGAIGGEYGTPIINHPEVAILGTGAIEERPMVVDGDVVARHTMPVSLSFDHRVLDGAMAGQFTNHVAEYLEDPRLLLLE